jgi:hypothetical protein
VGAAIGTVILFAVAFFVFFYYFYHRRDDTERNEGSRHSNRELFWRPRNNVKEVEMKQVQKNYGQASSVAATQRKNQAGGASGVEKDKKKGSQGMPMAHGDIYPAEKESNIEGSFKSAASPGSSALSTRRRASSAGQSESVDVTSGAVNTVRRKSIFSGLFGDSEGTSTPSARAADTGKPSMLDPELGASAGLSVRSMKGRRQAFISSSPVGPKAPQSTEQMPSSSPPPPPPPENPSAHAQRAVSPEPKRAGQPRNRLNETPRTPASASAHQHNRRGSGAGGSSGAKEFMDKL